MERATIYRAISAPTALVGGLLAVVDHGGAYLLRGDRSRPSALRRLGRPALLLSVWLFILNVVLAVNTLFVRQEARKGGRPFALFRCEAGGSARSRPA